MDKEGASIDDHVIELSDADLMSENSSAAKRAQPPKFLEQKVSGAAAKEQAPPLKQFQKPQEYVELTLNYAGDTSNSGQLTATTPEGIMTSAVGPYIAAYVRAMEKAKQLIPYDIGTAIITTQQEIMKTCYGRDGAEKLCNRITAGMEQSNVVSIDTKRKPASEEKSAAAYTV